MIAIRLIVLVIVVLTGSETLADRESREDREEREEREAWASQRTEENDIYTCIECRDLDRFPIDGANFALNQVWGPDSWMTVEQADRFRIRDRFGNVFHVDLNLDLQMLGIPVPGLKMPLFQNFIPYPTDLYLQVRLRDARYRLVHNDTIRPGDVEWPLPVGDDEASGRSYGDASDGDGGESEDVDDSSGEEFVDDMYEEEWSEADLGGEECESCTAAFDADRDGELDRDRHGDLIEYEL